MDVLLIIEARLPSDTYTHNTHVVCIGVTWPSSHFPMATGDLGTGKNTDTLAITNAGSYDLVSLTQESCVPCLYP